MIQLNLLPDVKMDYIKAQRSRRLVLSISVLVTAVALALLILLLSVSGLQKKHIGDLSKDIDKASKQLQNEPNIDKILTVQNQLESLTSLHAGKPATSRLFEYLNHVTPAPVSINDFDIDFTTQTAVITGTADTLSNVNKYVDTLKFTTYITKENSAKTAAFTNVVLTSFAIDGEAKDKAKAASYTITFLYDPIIFDITQEVTLSVPNLVTTRSELAKPGDLFQAPPESTKQEGTN
jgi:hypothetical protein